MSRARAVLGLIAGAILVASSAAHSLLGWKGLSAELSKANAPADLMRGVEIGWHFGGVAMLAFGTIVLMLFAEAVRGREVSLRPALVIAVAYLLFGAWALARELSPFFLVFIVPGLLLLLAAWPPYGAHDGRD